MILMMILVWGVGRRKYMSVGRKFWGLSFLVSSLESSGLDRCGGHREEWGGDLQGSL